MESKEFRIGNLLKYDDGTIVEVLTVSSRDIVVKRFPQPLNISVLHPILLTPEILEKAGFYQLPHFTIGDNWIKSLGRDRFLSVASVGTPNEMVFITEEVPPEVKAIIVAKNYDYDGKTYLHNIQNLYYALTGEELEINLT